MYRISLLPESYRSRVADTKKKKGVGRILAILVFAGVAVLGLSTAYKYMAEQQVAALEAQSAQLTNDIAMFQEVADLARQMDVLDGVVVKIEGNAPVLAEVLVTVGNNTPPHVVMNSISLQFTGGVGSGTIAGITDDHTNVSNWMRTLEQSGVVNNVKCTFASQQGEEGVSFDLNFSVLAAN